MAHLCNLVLHSVVASLFRKFGWQRYLKFSIPRVPKGLNKWTRRRIAKLAALLEMDSERGQGLLRSEWSVRELNGAKTDWQGHWRGHTIDQRELGCLTKLGRLGVFLRFLQNRHTGKRRSCNILFWCVFAIFTKSMWHLTGDTCSICNFQIWSTGEGAVSTVLRRPLTGKH